VTVESSAIREAFVTRLADCWGLKDPAWLRALEVVPRELFLGEEVYRNEGAGLWEIVRRSETPAGEWLQMAYSDQTWVTQLNNGTGSPSGAGRVTGIPTSSSTLPGVVAAMLEDLQVEDGHAVLEVGTGTGYSTALMCERLGASYVSSIEIDPVVAARAAQALATAGYRPRLLSADGLTGVPGQRFDRMIATCSVLSIPRAWLQQTRTGGKILTALAGWQYGFALARVTVTGPETAAGEFLDRTFSFMLARSQENPRHPVYFPDTDAQLTRPARYGPGILTGDSDDVWMQLWLAQLALPFSTHYPGSGPDGTAYIHDIASDSWAWFRRDGNAGYAVGQAGPVRVWDTIEHAIAQWHEAGSPPQREFALSIAGDVQTVAHPKIRDSWTLPTRMP
jgi:methyltransferase of ATP-grasp peptide maturase system